MKLKFLLIFTPIVLIMLLLLIGLCGNTLPEGTLIAESLSPNGLYQVNAYLCDGGATVDQSIRAEVVNVNNGKTRNIYWQYHAYDARIQWISEEIVVVNGITLNVLTDMYDYRKH